MQTPDAAGTETKCLLPAWACLQHPGGRVELVGDGRHALVALEVLDQVDRVGAQAACAPPGLQRHGAGAAPTSCRARPVCRQGDALSLLCTPGSCSYRGWASSSPVKIWRPPERSRMSSSKDSKMSMLCAHASAAQSCPDAGSAHGASRRDAVRDAPAGGWCTLRHRFTLSAPVGGGVGGAGGTSPQCTSWLS